MKILTIRDRNYARHLKHSHQLRAMMKRRERLGKVAGFKRGEEAK